MRTALWLACSMIAVCLLIGCGSAGEERSGEERVSSNVSHSKKPSPPADIFKDLPPPECPSHSEHFAVTLDGETGPENAGVLLASEEGFFEDAGLDVTAAAPRYPRRAVRYVATGIDHIGLAQQPQVLMARAEGVPIVAVGSVISQPTATMIWLKDSGIDKIADLDGRTIGIPGVPFQERFLGAVLAQAGLDLEGVDVEQVNFKPLIALREGKVDALFGTSWNIEGAALEVEGIQATVERVQDLGVPDYEELLVIARAECVRKHPEVFRDFMAAVARGTEAARKQPKEAARVIAMGREFDPEFSRKKLQAQLQATLPLLAANRWMDPQRAASLSRWMREEGIINREPPVAETFTNDFLATP